MVEANEKKEELKTFNMLNDCMFKAVFRSVDARGVVASILQEITGISKEVFMDAYFVSGEIPKKIINEKGKTADIIIKVEKDLTLIVEMNQFHNDNIGRKNLSYAYATYIESTTGGKSPVYPKVILINIDNYNYNGVDVAIQEFRSRDQFGNIEDGDDIIKNICYLKI